MHLTGVSHGGIEQLEGSLVGICGNIQTYDRLLLVIIDGRVLIESHLTCLLLGNLLITEDGVGTIERIVVTMRIGLCLHVLDILIPDTKLSSTTCHAIHMKSREIGRSSSPKIHELVINSLRDILHMSRIESPLPIRRVLNKSDTLHLTRIASTVTDGLYIDHAFSPGTVVAHLSDITTKEFGIKACPTCQIMCQSHKTFAHSKSYCVEPIIYVVHIAPSIVDPHPVGKESNRWKKIG
jgi:hypothetical protein